MPFTISICGKGGVGKTTTTVMLGVGLHRAGQNTMLVDVDEQATLSRTWAGGAESSADLPAVVYMSASTVARDLKKVHQPEYVVLHSPRYVCLHQWHMFVGGGMEYRVGATLLEDALHLFAVSRVGYLTSQSCSAPAWR